MIKILIVDDDEEEIGILGQCLEEHGYACTLAPSAADGRKLLERNDFHLILSDIHMPGESGLDFMKWALSTRPYTAGIIMSGQVNPEVIEKARTTGAYCCLDKPLAVETLLTSVSRAIERAD